MISKSQVKHIAKLARLSLTEKEIKKFQKELSSILDFVEKLKQVDISNIEVDFYLTPKATFGKGMKEDEPEKPDIKTMKKLIKLAPETKEGHIKVKSIF